MSPSRLLAPVNTARAASAPATVTTNLGCPDGPSGVTVMPVTVIGVPYHLDEYLPELGVLALDAAVGEPDVDHLQQPRLAGVAGLDRAAVQPGGQVAGVALERDHGGVGGGAGPGHEPVREPGVVAGGPQGHVRRAEVGHIGTVPRPGSVRRYSA